MRLGKLGMGNRRAVIQVAAASTLAVAGALPALIGAKARADVPSTVTLLQVSNDQGAEAGEPGIATDPRTGTIVIDWLGTSDVTTQTGGDPNNASPANITRGYCGVAAWNPSDPNLLYGPKPLDWELASVPGNPEGVGPIHGGVQNGDREFPICGDPVLGADPLTGTIVAGAAQIASPSLEQAITSRDDGYSWSYSTEVFGVSQDAAGAAEYGAEAGRPPIGPGRAFMAIDPNTGHIAYISQEDGGAEGRWLVESKDDGATWSTPRPLTPDVQGSTAGPESAAHGVIAVTYINNQMSATYESAPTKGFTCASGETTCVVFQTTNELDAANNWTRHEIPGFTPDPSSVIANPGYVAADPSRPGHFTVLGTTHSGATLEVYETFDSGATWAVTHTVSAPPGDTFTKTALQYSPDTSGPQAEALGMVYRVVDANNSFNVYAQISGDGGNTWSEPVLLTTHGPTPPNTGMSDDCACNMDMAQGRLTTGWGDERQGSDQHIGPRQLWVGSFDYTKLADATRGSE